MSDSKWMRLALNLARRGQGFVEPNPMVGAIVVRDGEKIAEGWHQKYGEAHAEVNALAQAGEAARGATLYVTLEPCCHWGKTPPCADAVIQAGVKHVVVAMADPFPKVAGSGIAKLRAAGIEDAQRLKLESLGCDVLPVTGVAELLAEFGRRHYTNVLVEGGAAVFGAFRDANLIDEVHVFIARTLIGGAAALSPVAGTGA